MKERTCLECRFCDLDLGEHGYSEMTPGGPGSFHCAKGHFSYSGDEFFGTEKAWKQIQVATTCADFQPAHWLKAKDR